MLGCPPARMPDVNARDSCGRTPLHHATMRGHEEIVSMFMNCKQPKADISAMDHNHQTAATLAIEVGKKKHRRTVQMLLEEHNLDANATGIWGDTLIHHAVIRGRVGMVRMLYKCGADVNARDTDGRTALSLAIEAGHDEVARLLVSELGFNVNNRGSWERTAVHYAAMNGNQALFRILADCGACVEAVDDGNRGVLHFAAMAGHEGMISMLVNEYKINPDSRSWWDETPLHFAVMNFHQAIIRKLIDCGADVNARDNHNRTPLHFATAIRNITMIRTLMECGSQVSTSDLRGDTALHYAASSGSEEVVLTLIDSKADIEAKNMLNMTPLHYAARMGHHATVCILVARGADISCKDGDSNTPLDMAALEGHEITVQNLVLEHKAEISNATMKRIDACTCPRCEGIACFFKEQHAQAVEDY
ncbi:ankyrin repeat-containing domain protein [Trichophaea hybrida]|nr:ankyrin repeat-containing domain protein [Trichophaea hybrida]